jgi:hypothetical protein
MTIKSIHIQEEYFRFGEVLEELIMLGELENENPIHL